MSDTMTDSTRLKLYTSYVIAEDISNKAFAVGVADERDSKGRFQKRTELHKSALKVAEAWYNLAQSTFNLAWHTA